MMSSEVIVFLYFIVTGLFIGVLFDFFRALRKTLNNYDFIVYIEDVLFWIITGFTILYVCFYVNKGELRGYMFVGIMIGCCLYFMIFTKFVKKVFALILGSVLKLLQIIFNVLFMPIKLLEKMIKRGMPYAKREKIYKNKENKT